MEKNWFVFTKKRHIGPFTAKEIFSKLDGQEIFEEDYLWKSGYENWLPFSEVKSTLNQELNEINKEETNVLKGPVNFEYKGEKKPLEKIGEEIPLDTLDQVTIELEKFNAPDLPPIPDLPDLPIESGEEEVDLEEEKPSSVDEFLNIIKGSNKEKDTQKEVQVLEEKSEGGFLDEAINTNIFEEVFGENEAKDNPEVKTPKLPSFTPASSLENSKNDESIEEKTQLEEYNPDSTVEIAMRMDKAMSISEITEDPTENLSEEQASSHEVEDESEKHNDQPNEKIMSEFEEDTQEIDLTEFKKESSNESQVEPEDSEKVIESKKEEKHKEQEEQSSAIIKRWWHHLTHPVFLSFFVLMILLAGGFGAYKFYYTEGFKKPGLMSSIDYNRLRKVANLDLSKKLEVGHAFSKSGKMLWIVSNYDEDVLLKIKFTSIPGKVLTDDSVLVESTGSFVKHIGTFKKFYLKKGQLKAGFYNLEILGERPLNPNKKLKNKFKYNEVIYWGIGGVSIEDFKEKIAKYNNYIKNKKNVHYNEIMEGYKTILTLLNRTSFLFFDILKKVNKGRDFVEFDRIYSNQVGKMMTSLVIGNDKVYTELLDKKNPYAKFYLELNNETKNIGEFISEQSSFVKSKEWIGDKTQKDIIAKVTDQFEEFEAILKNKHKSVQAELVQLNSN